MKRWTLLTALTAIALTALAQNPPPAVRGLTPAVHELTQTVRGVVTDKTSEKPLPGVTVQVIGISPVMATVTDESGRYTLPAVPLGRQQFAYGSAGYQPVVIPEVLVTAGKEPILDIALEQK